VVSLSSPSEDMLEVAMHELSAPVGISELCADQHCCNDTDLAGFQSLWTTVDELLARFSAVEKVAELI
jgi:hypothetical protein